MKNVLFIVPTKDFRDADYTEPSSALGQEDMAVTVAASDWRCEGSLGTIVKPDLLVKNVNVHDFDALFIVGGIGARDLAVDLSVIDLVREFGRTPKIITAIGNGVTVLAAAGLLEGRYVGATVVGADYILSKGAKLSKQSIVVDGRIITAVDHVVAYETGRVLARLI
jgi:protease I